MKKYVITAAGGNATAIGVIEEPMDRSWYERQGTVLMKEFQDLDVEQVGFLVLSQNHFEMSGAEFCGNGSRAAGLLFCMLLGMSDGHTFTTSGHEGEMSVEIDGVETAKPFVTGIFPSLDATARPINVSGVEKAEIVDLGGIVHVLIYGAIPETREGYEAEHRRVTKELGLQDRAAVGVDWVQLAGLQVKMDPVVWVNAASEEDETFFYETSCGSGSISAAVATGINYVLQPSGEIINVNNRDGAMTIASPMEVIHGT